MVVSSLRMDTSSRTALMSSEMMMGLVLVLVQKPKLWRTLWV